MQDEEGIAGGDVEETGAGESVEEGVGATEEWNPTNNCAIRSPEAEQVPRCSLAALYLLGRSSTSLDQRIGATDHHIYEKDFKGAEEGYCDTRGTPGVGEGEDSKDVACGVQSRRKGTGAWTTKEVHERKKSKARIFGERSPLRAKRLSLQNPARRAVVSKNDVESL